MRPELIRGHLDTLVLAVLEAGPLHGYAIISELRARSGNLFQLPEGSVYPALYRLERMGAISSSRSSVDGRSRRVYRLARRGRAALTAQREEWRAFSGAVNTILGAVPA
jgi:DNA-binding PadR family transcriptional regulator